MYINLKHVVVVMYFNLMHGPLYLRSYDCFRLAGNLKSIGQICKKLLL